MKLNFSITLLASLAVFMGVSAHAGDTQKAISEVTFIAFDVETTGLSPKKERVVELGAVKWRNGKIVDTRNWLINPGKKIPYYATKVHHITDDMVENEPVFGEVLPEFNEFIEGAILLAHNARFDVNFVCEEIARFQGDVPENRVLDSLKIFRAWYPELKSHSLGKVAGHVGISKGDFHRAEEDSAYLIAIFNKGLSSRGITTMDELLKDSGKPLEFKPRGPVQTASLNK